MITWIKDIWTKLRVGGISAAIDALDYAEPFLSEKLDETKAEFSRKTSQEQAKWIVDKVQEFLRRKAGL